MQKILGGIFVMGLAGLGGCGPSEPHDFERTDALLAEGDALLAEFDNYIIPPKTWNVSEKKSEMTDDTGVYLSLPARAYDGKYGRPVQPMLSVRCMEKETNVYIGWGEYLGDDSGALDNWKRVRVRVNDDPVESLKLSLSTDKEAIGWWDGGSAVVMARRLGAAEKLVVQVTPYNESPREAVYDVSELRQHLPKVAAACGWKVDDAPAPAAR